MRQPRSPFAVAQISLFVSSKDAPEPFRKAVQVLHSLPKAPISLLQRKVANAWLKNALETTPDENGWFEMTARELNTDVGFDSKASAYMRETADRLMSIVFEWDVIAAPGKRTEWKKSVLFPEVEARGGTIRYQFSNEMRKVLLNPEVYALIDMAVVRRFRRASSLAIWEHCIRFERIGQTAEVEWEKFRDMMLGESADAETYKEYKYFKAKVLKPAVAEINSESNHHIELTESKVGKRVRGLRFTVKKKGPEPQGSVPEDGRIQELVGELVRLGLPQSEARKLCSSQGYDQVKRALEYTKQRAAAKGLGKLDNPAAYFRHALANNYAPAEAAETLAKPVEIRDEYLRHQLGEAQRYFRELDPSDQAALIEKYNGQQNIIPLRIKKAVSKATEASFYRWLGQATWGEPTAEGLLSFAQTMLQSRA